MRKATQGRIDQEILSAAGLRAVRWLAACRMISSRGASEDEELGAAGALEFSISQINDRMGRRRGAWLNALSLIAKPLLGALYENSDGVGRLYADGTYQAEVLERRSELLAAISELLAAIDEIRQADGARVIGPNVAEDVDGFRRLIKLSPYAVNVIRRAMIDGMEIGSIKTWHYFRGAIADEERVCADASESKAKCVAVAQAPEDERDGTIKQDAFAMAYIETGNASEAYRRTYDAGNMAPHTLKSRRAGYSNTLGSP